LARPFFPSSHPAVKRACSDDGDQFFNGSPNLGAVLEQPLTFGRARVYFARNARSQNLVLLFEIFDILCQFAVRGRGN